MQSSNLKNVCSSILTKWQENVTYYKKQSKKPESLSSKTKRGWRSWTKKFLFFSYSSSSIIVILMNFLLMINFLIISHQIITRKILQTNLARLQLNHKCKKTVQYFLEINDHGAIRERFTVRRFQFCNKFLVF